MLYGITLLISGAFGISAGGTYFKYRVIGYGLFVASFAAGVVAFGLLIWGSTLAFGFNRWHRIVVAPAGNTPANSPCEIELYHPIASAIIVAWILVGKSRAHLPITISSSTCKLPLL